MSERGGAAGGGKIAFLLALAWRNLSRHKRRSVITASAMAVALSMCMASICWSDGTYDTIFDVMVQQQLGHVQVHHPDYPKTHGLYDTLKDVPDLLSTLDALPGTRAASPRLNGFALVGGEKKSAGGQIVGIDPERERAVSPLAKRVKEGHFLSEKPDHEVIIGRGLADDLKLGVGDELIAVTQAADGSLGNDLYHVVGIFKSGNAAMDRSGAYMHIDDLRELLALPGQAHGIQLLAKDPEAIAAYAEQVREAVGGPKVQVQTWWEVSPQTKQLMDTRDSSSFLILGIVFVVAAFGVLNTMMMSVFERTRELGVLKALGLRPGQMIWLIVFESAFLAVLAGAIGLALGSLLDWYLVVHGIDYTRWIADGFSFAGVTLDPVMKGAVRVTGIVYTLLSLFGVSVLASLWPAARAARLRPVEAIRTE